MNIKIRINSNQIQRLQLFIIDNNKRKTDYIIYVYWDKENNFDKYYINLKVIYKYV